MMAAHLGLQGMINDVLKQSDYATGTNLNGEVKHLKEKDYKAIARINFSSRKF